MKKTVNIYLLSFEINLEKVYFNLLFSPYLGPQSNPFQNLDKSAALQEVKIDVVFSIKCCQQNLVFARIFSRLLLYFPGSNVQRNSDKSSKMHSYLDENLVCPQPGMFMSNYKGSE